MEKLWAGRAEGTINKIADAFNASIGVDSRMYKQDIEGSIAHAKMLCKCGIISESDKEAIVKGLQGILSEIESGTSAIDMKAEDIHTFIESELTARIGDAGKRLHTARSRNDQVALDFRMYLRAESEEIDKRLRTLIGVLAEKAELYKSTVMPGYTHLQRAQPITFGQHLLAYAEMFMRDCNRLADTKKRINISPIGSCALAGTTYATDRRYEATLLGFDGICNNSMDGVSDRDFAAEFMFDCSLIMMHLSRFAEEVILWTSFEFGYVELSDAFTTGSSIMPQKKNSDMAELVRGKTGRVYGNLMGILTMLKGLPLAYNKDMQEDKEGAFDSADTVKICLDVFAPMLETMKVKGGKMRKSAEEGFINATDLADYLVRKGLPFRSAYKISGQAVGYCIATGKTLESLSLDEYKAMSELIDSDVYDAISLETCVSTRISEGGTCPSSVEKQITAVKEFLK